MMKDSGVIVASAKNFRRRRLAKIFFAFFLVGVVGSYKPVPKETSKLLPSEFVREKILTEGLSFPWEIVWGPDHHIWMTERGGRISRVNPVTGSVTSILKVPDVKARGEGGLLGMALHPDFKTVPQVFIVYNYSDRNSYREKVVRYNYANGQLVSPTTILDNIDAAGIHNGSRLLFSPDKKLFITTGDASNQSSSQELNNLNGKILRIHPDGTIPSDNPYPGNPVWSYGHRNPQGLVFIGSRLFSSEHGPSTDDEINIIEKGRNYGWPTITGYCSGNEKKFCEGHQIKEPVKVWTPTIAVCGLDYYNHDRIPGWKNSLLLTSLRANLFIKMELGEDHQTIVGTQTLLQGKYGRLRDVCIAPDGKVYVCTGNGTNDKIIVFDM